MPEKKTQERARRKKRAGKKPTTQAGEYVREEMEHKKEGKHKVKSKKQAIAIGLSKARKSGVSVPKKKGGKKKAKKATSRKKASKSRKKTSTSRKKVGGRRKGG
jgi:hypothetical protein